MTIDRHPLNIFFEKIYCINVLENKERKDNVIKRFEKIGIEVEFFTPVRYDEINSQFLPYLNKEKELFKFPSEISCAMSHYSCIKDAYYNNYRNILIFEDDVTFVKNFNEIINSYLESLPDDWDVLYFYSGIYAWNLRHIFLDESMKLFKTADVNGCIAYAINNKMFSEIINEYDTCFDISDNILSRRMQKNPKYNFYSVYTNLCAQNKNTSSVNPNKDDVIDVFPFMVTFGNLKESDFLE